MKNGTKRARPSQKIVDADVLFDLAGRARLLCMAVSGIEGTVRGGSAITVRDVEPVGTLALVLAIDIERVFKQVAAADALAVNA
jgi:hypothetical protein